MYINVLVKLRNMHPLPIQPRGFNCIGSQDIYLHNFIITPSFSSLSSSLSLSLFNVSVPPFTLCQQTQERLYNRR